MSENQSGAVNRGITHYDIFVSFAESLSFSDLARLYDCSFALRPRGCSIGCRLFFYNKKQQAGTSEKKHRTSVLERVMCVYFGYLEDGVEMLPVVSQYPYCGITALGHE